jgi:ribosome-associated toxin RatA of RatAB toxin-antitoxin module
MVLEDGPFSELEGSWEFTRLGDAGCKVSLRIRFGFESRVTDLVMGPPFEAICNQLVDAFVKRARAVVGGEQARKP